MWTLKKEIRLNFPWVRVKVLTPPPLSCNPCQSSIQLQHAPSAVMSMLILWTGATFLCLELNFVKKSAGELLSLFDTLFPYESWEFTFYFKVHVSLEPFFPNSDILSQTNQSCKMPLNTILDYGHIIPSPLISGVECEGSSRVGLRREVGTVARRRRCLRG